MVGCDGENLVTNFYLPSYESIVLLSETNSRSRNDERNTTYVSLEECKMSGSFRKTPQYRMSEIIVKPEGLPDTLVPEHP